MRDVGVGVIELWVGIYLLGLVVGFAEMAVFAWLTRGTAYEESYPAGRFWSQYVAVVFSWPVVVGWVIAAWWRGWRERRRR